MGDQPTSKQKFYSPQEVAQLVGVTDKTVLNWAKEGLLRHYKFKRAIRFWEADVKAFIHANEQKGGDSK